MEQQKIMVERDTYTKNGQEYFSYFIKANIRGKENRIGVIPPDNGGYAVLDIVFGNEMAAELVLKPYEIKDEKTGQVVKGNSYAVRLVDEDGVVYECPIKPARTSDKNMLTMLIR